MNGWLLDTNVIAELTKPHGSARVRNWVAGQSETLIFVSIMTLGEYEKGLANLPADSPRRATVAAAIAALETRFAGRILPIGNATVRRWGLISGLVKLQTGQTPPVIDTMLAATAIEHDLRLVTQNIRDVQFSGARLLNPWDEDVGT